MKRRLMGNQGDALDFEAGSVQTDRRHGLHAEFPVSAERVHVIDQAENKNQSRRTQESRGWLGRKQGCKAQQARKNHGGQHHSHERKIDGYAAEPRYWNGMDVAFGLGRVRPALGVGEVADVPSGDDGKTQRNHKNRKVNHGVKRSVYEILWIKMDLLKHKMRLWRSMDPLQNRLVNSGNGFHHSPGRKLFPRSDTRSVPVLETQFFVLQEELHGLGQGSVVTRRNGYTRDAMERHFRDPRIYLGVDHR